ncbi:unnamed protein product, partial [Urochloa humidicola]
QLSRRRRGKRPPPTKNRGTTRRYAGARSKGAGGGGGGGHGHFGHVSSKKQADRDPIRSDPVQETEWPRNRGRRVDVEAVLQRRRRWDHDEDVCGCRGRSIRRIGGTGMVELSSLLFPSRLRLTPSPQLPPRDIYFLPQEKMLLKWKCSGVGRGQVQISWLGVVRFVLMQLEG